MCLIVLCSVLVRRYAAFLSPEMREDRLREALPSFEALSATYGLGVATVFHFTRKAMHDAPSTSSWHPESKTLSEALQTCLTPSPDWRAISTTLFVKFWSTSLYDIFVPEKQYAEQIKLLKFQRDAASNDESLTVCVSAHLCCVAWLTLASATFFCLPGLEAQTVAREEERNGPNSGK